MTRCSSSGDTSTPRRTAPRAHGSKITRRKTLKSFLMPHFSFITRPHGNKKSTFFHSGEEKGCVFWGFHLGRRAQLLTIHLLTSGEEEGGTTKSIYSTTQNTCDVSSLNSPTAEDEQNALIMMCQFNLSPFSINKKIVQNIIPSAGSGLTCVAACGEKGERESVCVCVREGGERVCVSV